MATQEFQVLQQHPTQTNKKELQRKIKNRSESKGKTQVKQWGKVYPQSYPET